ncbi:MAG: NlpC/P60 family protein [Mycobacteriaceae bacterium]|nr:NlpC/P60 family protein [Mycobacteriaceae bacterium]
MRDMVLRGAMGALGILVCLFAVGALAANPARAATGSANSGSADSGSANLAGAATGSAGSGSGVIGPIVLPVPSPRGLAALAWAATQTGKPYRWGGSGPEAFDCSGLVQWAFRHAGVRLPRTTWQQAGVGISVPVASLAPGDVVVVNRDGSHVGIYAGFGQMFNAYARGFPIGLVPLRHFHIYAIRRF